MTGKYGDKSMYFDLGDLGNITGQWDLYGSDAPSPYNSFQVVILNPCLSVSAILESWLCLDRGFVDGFMKRKENGRWKPNSFIWFRYYIFLSLVESLHKSVIQAQPNCLRSLTFTWECCFHPLAMLVFEFIGDHTRSTFRIVFQILFIGQLWFMVPNNSMI